MRNALINIPAHYQNESTDDSQVVRKLARRAVVAIPCLNEAQTIRKVLRSIPRSIDGVEEIILLVVDDGSTDKTAQEAVAEGAEVISHKINRGLGVAFQSAVDYAIEHDADLLVTIDGDGQFDPSEIPKLVSPILKHEADFVTGSRFLSNDAYPTGIPKIKLWGNRRMSYLVSRLTGQKFYDVSCGFRAYSKHALLHLNLHGKFTYTQEAFLDLCFRGFRIQEQPIRVVYHPERKSRVANSVIRYAFNTLFIIFRAFRDYRPLRFFWTCSGILFTIASALAMVFLAYFFQTGRFYGYLWAGFLSGFIYLMSMAFFVLGIVVDMFDRSRVNQEKTLVLLREIKSHLRGREE